MFRIIEPVVPGGLEIEPELDNSIHPPLISKCHIEFEGWLGNDIVLRAGARSLVLRLRQGYGACTLLAAEQYHTFKNPNS